MDACKISIDQWLKHWLKIINHNNHPKLNPLSRRFSVCVCDMRGKKLI